MLITTNYDLYLPGLVFNLKVYGQSITDRNEYIKRLEIQLNKSGPCRLLAQGFKERIDQISGQIISVEERNVNLTRLIKLLQENDEFQEQELTKLKDNSKGSKPRSKASNKVVTDDIDKMARFMR